MRGFLQKVFGRKEAQNDGTEQEWVVICLPLSGKMYGSEEERDEVRTLGHEIDAAIRSHGVGIFDGDEFGNGEGRLFAYGPNADQIFEAIEPLLRSRDHFEKGYVIKRYGNPESERVDF